MQKVEQKAVNLCKKLQGSIYPKHDDESISLIENYKKWVSENESSLPRIFLETWNDILDLETKLKNVKQSPNNSEIIKEAVDSSIKCNEKLSNTIRKLKNN